MRAALLLWDQVKVIVPYKEYRPVYSSDTMSAAWEVIGDTLHPDDYQKELADKNIRDLLNAGPILELYREGNMQTDHPLPFEIWPQKLLPETWNFLRDRSLTSQPLANGDYPFEEQSGLAVMSKLADACAGDTFARWTDRFLAYGLVADRNSQVALESTVIPLTLSLIDTTHIPTKALISFRQREIKEHRGFDYTNMRHAYAEYVNGFIDSIKSVRSDNELKERYRQFEEESATHVRVLSEALDFNIRDLVTSSAIVSVVVGATSWLGVHHSVATLTAGIAAGAAPTIAQGVMGLFHSRNTYSSKQRDLLAGNPLAYVYQLSRVT